MDNLPYFDLYFNPWNEDTIALNTNPPSSSPRDENVNTEAGSRKNLDAVNEECNTENYLKSFHNYLANNIHLYHGIDNILPGDYEINDGMESSSEQYESNEDNTLNRRGAYYAKLPARYFSKSKRQVPEEYNISNEQLENDGSDAFGRGDPCTAPTPGGVSLLVQQQMRNFKQAPNAFLSSPGDENADNSFETELQENPDAANNATSRTYETANGHAAPSKHEHSDDSSESSQQSSGSFSRSHHNKFVKPIFIDSSVRHGGNIGGSYVLAAGGVIAMEIAVKPESGANGPPKTVTIEMEVENRTYRIILPFESEVPNKSLQIELSLALLYLSNMGNAGISETQRPSPTADEKNNTAGDSSSEIISGTYAAGFQSWTFALYARKFKKLSSAKSLAFLGFICSATLMQSVLSCPSEPH